MSLKGEYGLTIDNGGFKRNDLVWYKDKLYNIGYIDNHEYPICLIRGPRVRPEDIKLFELNELKGE